MDKRVLITGAGGFLGTELIRQGTEREDLELWALSSDPDRIRKLEGERDHKLHVRPREFLYTREFTQMRFDCIINCAYPRNSKGPQVADGLKYISDLFRLAAESKAGSVINISSQSVYDPERREPAKESDSLCLTTPYAVGKYATELILDDVCGDIAHTNIRLGSLIGPKFDQRIVNRFVKKALNMEEIQVNRSEQRFGFMDVKDAAKGIWSLSGISKDKWKPVYNLGNDAGYTLVDIIESIREVFEEQGIPFPSAVINEGDGKGTSAVNCALLEEDTGFRPCVTLKESIRRIQESS